MNHSHELSKNMNRERDQLIKLLFDDDVIEKTRSISSSSIAYDFGESNMATSTPTWKTIQRYKKPASSDFDANHFRSR